MIKPKQTQQTKSQDNLLGVPEKHTKGSVMLFLALLLVWPFFAAIINMILEGIAANAIMPVNQRPYNSPPLTIIAVILPSVLALITLWPVTLFVRSFIKNVQEKAQLAVKITYLSVLFFISAFFVIFQNMGSISYMGCFEACTHVYMPYNLQATSVKILTAVLVVNLIITAWLLFKRSNKPL